MFVYSMYDSRSLLTKWQVCIFTDDMKVRCAVFLVGTSIYSCQAMPGKFAAR